MNISIDEIRSAAKAQLREEIFKEAVAKDSSGSKSVVAELVSYREAA